MRMAAVIALLLVVAVQSHAAFELFEFATAEQETRYKNLATKLRCLVCQNQSLADSEAALASDLRNVLHERITRGETDEQIVGYLLERYGDFVLYTPPFRLSTVLLWASPFLMLVLGLLILRKIAASGRTADKK